MGSIPWLQRLGIGRYHGRPQFAKNGRSQRLQGAPGWRVDDQEDGTSYSKYGHAARQFN
jgi:hypothetical protein